MELKDLADLYGEELHIKQLRKTYQGSPRAQEIEKRSNLNSEDGAIIDEHDQFYRDHKLLLVLFRGSDREDHLRLDYLGYAVRLCRYVVMTLIVVLVSYERLDILLNKSKKFDEYIYSIIFIIFPGAPFFWIPFVGWGVAYEVCDYKNGWGKFQLHYYKIAGRRDLNGYET
ncbi:hypothetical protein NQ317_010366 [Molorchus minor]|uniref:Uncharacterized protein n=1 Tax=Molorchus minor TaxID=1323400 RepID=A0ABQ9JEK8_9CUCU|nr:hypothetical protein NQ317_010366 [Molorchus minor]